MKTLTYLTIALLSLAPAAAQAEPAPADAVKIETHGVYRPRVELDHRFNQTADVFVIHRARVSVGLTAGDWKAYLEPQDVRVWGTEANTAVQEGRLDLHQGYAEYNASPLLQARVGRQEVAYLNHRLIGNLDWVQPGRSFDALRLSGKEQRIQWDGFAGIVSNQTGKGLKDNGVAALLLKWSNAGRNTALLAVNDWTPSAKNYRWTFGPYVDGRVLRHVTYRAEGYYQRGHKPGDDFYKAYMMGAQAGFEPVGVTASPRIGIAYDRVSGKQGKNWVPFDTLYATNHKFYGFMDVFTNLPKNTGGAGLQDASVYAGATVSSLDVQAAFHRFLVSGDVGIGRVFGNEEDLIATWKFTTNASLQLGYTLFQSQEAFEALHPKASPNPTWSYAMLTVGI
jgi:hypothetical protein